MDCQHIEGMAVTQEKLRIDGASLTLHHDAPEMAAGIATMAVSHIAFSSAEAGAQLLTQAVAQARAAGAGALIGPMEGDTWHAYRLVSESGGRAPFLMEPQSGPHDMAAFDNAGFSVIGRYFSASVTLATQDLNPPRDTDLRVEPWDGSAPESLFTQVHALSCTAFADNPYYRPLSLEAFLAMYMPIVPMLKPELVLFARDAHQGALAGFLFGIPDYAEGHAPQTAILKTYASLRKGAGHALSHRFHSNARALGYTHAIHALMHENNLSAGRSAWDGADIFRRYALMGKRLDG